MKVKLTTYEYVKQEIEGKEYEIPDETSYFFETGVRRAIRMVPVWTTWLKEEGKEEHIHSYKVTCVYRSMENKVETFNISVHTLGSEFSDNAKGKQADFVRALLNGWFDKRTKEQFEQDLQASINEFNDIRP